MTIDEFETNIKNYINNNQNIMTKLNINEREYLIKSFNNSAMINEIKNVLDDILKDGKIDYHDIPNIVLLITKIFSNYLIYNRNLNILNIIKFTIECIVFSHMSSLSDNDIIIYDNIISISIQLLATSPNILNTKCNCLSFLCKKRNNL